MNFTPADHSFMSQALKLARKGLYTTHPNPRVGCVIVRDGHVIGRGYHIQPGCEHAEINAIKDASGDIAGSDVYVTLEPCSHTGKTPPCAEALVNSGVKRVVAAMQDPNPDVAGRGLALLQNQGIEVGVGLLESDARSLNPGFIMRMEQKRPFVRVKMGASLDGRTAMANGESQWITSPAARQDVQFYRAQASAVLTGLGTAKADNPSLNVRLDESALGIDIPVRQPDRVILDTQLRLSPDAHMLSLAGRTIIYTGLTQQQLKSSKHYSALQAKQASIVSVGIDSAGGLDLKQVMESLAQDFEVNEIHTEAGATLCGALFEADLVDELVLYVAPALMGSGARGLFDMPALQHLQDKVQLSFSDVRQVGDDLRIIARRK